MIVPGRHIVLIAAIALVGLAACETGIDPFDTDVDRRYAVHGFLDSGADSQYVRLQALRRASDPLDAVPEGVSVHLVGAGPEWGPVTGADPDGIPVYGFMGVFRPEPGRRYDLVVERDGVQGALGSTVVPPVPGVIAALAEGGAVSLTKNITLTGLGPLRGDLAIWYEVYDPFADMYARIEIDYNLPWTGDERTFTVFLTLDRAEILRRLGHSQSYRDVELLATGAHVELRSEEWGSSDLDPGMLDGHGFFGSVGRYDVHWVLPEVEVRTMGLVDAQEP